jgi:hypothetical protein
MLLPSRSTFGLQVRNHKHGTIIDITEQKESDATETEN